MLTNLILHTASFSDEDNKLVSCLYLVADSIDQANQIFCDHKWSMAKSAQDIEKLIKSNPDFLMYTSLKECRKGAFRPLAIGKKLLFSNDHLVRRALFDKQGLNVSNVILLLAACGLELSLPNVKLDINAEDELMRVKEKLKEERLAYLAAITNIADLSFDRLKQGIYQDTLEWAKNEAIFKVLPRVKELERKLNKMDTSLLRKLALESWKNGLPAITNTLMRKGFAEAGIVAAHELLKILCTSLAESYEKRQIPEANYGICLSKELT